MARKKLVFGEIRGTEYGALFALRSVSVKGYWVYTSSPGSLKVNFCMSKNAWNKLPILGIDKTPAPRCYRSTLLNLQRENG